MNADLNFRLTEEQIERLKKGWVAKPGEGELFTIKGINKNGRNFTTTGRITTLKGKPVVYDDIVFFEFGKKKDESVKETTKFVARFFIDATEEETNFYVETIYAENGDIIYHNDEFQKVREMIENRPTKKFFSPILLDAKMLEEQNVIGKPVIICKGDNRIEETCGVLIDFFVDGSGLNIEIMEHTMHGSIKLHNNSLLTEDCNGKMDFLFKYDKERTEFMESDLGKALISLING